MSFHETHIKYDRLISQAIHLFRFSHRMREQHGNASLAPPPYYISASLKRTIL